MWFWLSGLERLLCVIEPLDAVIWVSGLRGERPEKRSAKRLHHLSIRYRKSMCVRLAGIASLLLEEGVIGCIT